jgi:hypothetical protein
MSLLDYTALQTQKSVNLTTDGQTLANTLATALLAWSARFCNRLTWAHGGQTEVFSPDTYQDTFYVSCLPLDTCPRR